MFLKGKRRYIFEKNKAKLLQQKFQGLFIDSSLSININKILDKIWYCKKNDIKISVFDYLLKRISEQRQKSVDIKQKSQIQNQQSLSFYRNRPQFNQEIIKSFKMSSSSLNSQSVSTMIQNQSSQSPLIRRQQQISANNQSFGERQLQELKERISLSKEELIQICNKQNLFYEKVFQFNYEAKKLIENNKIEEALIFLNQAEKILQFTASCGKNIERKMIMEVLHNQACCYQILWDLEKCSNYIEALIFNFNSELKFTDPQNLQTPSSDIQMSSGKKSLSPEEAKKAESVRIQKKIQLAKYYLLYCAINSQLKNNQGALVAAQKASQITKGVLEELLYIFEEQRDAQNESKLPSFVHQMLQEIPKLQSSININKVDELFGLVRHYIKVYNSKCIFNNLSSSKGFRQFSQNNNKSVYEKYKNFSIGNIMQLQPIASLSMNQIQSRSVQNDRINYEKLIQKIIVFSICQFTMATQLRYIALTNAKGEKQLSHTLVEFKQSQAYHLLSILIVAMYMPFDIIYMQHIISSYHGHYKTVLLSNGLDGTPEIDQDQIKRIKENILYNPKQSSSVSSSRGKDDTKKCSTTNHSNGSIIVSFHEEEEESKNQSANKQFNRKKNSFKKDQLKCSFIHDQDPLTVSQNRLFDEYYYCKKNTEQDPGLAYQPLENNQSKLMKEIKSISKDKKSLKKSNSKFQRKSKSKSKQENQFIAKPSTINIQKDSQKYYISQIKSQINPHIVHSPLIVPQVYSKIVVKNKHKKSKSKDIKFKNQFKENIDTTKRESQYFPKPNFNKKNPHNTLCLNKSPVNKNKSTFKRKQLEEIQKEYFLVHNPNVVKNNKSPIQKKISNKETRKSASQSKKQRLSSKSFQKAISPNRMPKKQNLAFQKSKPASNISKDKRSRLTQNTGRSTISSAIYNNRDSIERKKSQNQKVYNMVAGLRLKTEESQIMKASHFDDYYL